MSEVMPLLKECGEGVCPLCIEWAVLKENAMKVYAKLDCLKGVNEVNLAYPNLHISINVKYGRFILEATLA